MRNLTVSRKKKFTGCLAKMKVYIENPTFGDTMINNTPCTLLGTLKNGEQKTFQIADDSLKLFVIADKLSKNYCNDFYEIPAGQYDINLSGQNVFNLAAGNPFRFDGNTSAAALDNRKRGSKKGSIILILSVLIGFVLGLSLTNVFLGEKDKEFSSHGMKITLTSNFKETNFENYTVAYDSKDIAVFALKEPFSAADGFEDYTLDQYAEIVIMANNFKDTNIYKKDSLKYLKHTYHKPEDNTDYIFYDFIYKADDSFWLIQIATAKKNVDKYEKQIMEWAKSVKFE